MGSKARVADQICPIINSAIQKSGFHTYIEPFVGGANVIQHIQCDTKYGLDNNSYLIAFWQALQNGWNPHDFPMSKDTYKAIRANKSAYPPHVVALAGFCASYNSKWFGGYASLTHTKIGTVRNYYDEAIRNVLAQVPHLQDVVFRTQDFFTLSSNNAVIYCDPPYKSTTGYHEAFNSEEYWQHVRELSRDNVVLCSEYSAPNDFTCIWQKKLITTLDHDSRSTATEKLFYYKEGLWKT